MFQPQIELLNHLRVHGFKIFIVSGGGIDFIRAFAETVYGVPPEQVIGSSVKTHVETKDGAVEIMKAAELNSFDDREAKVENIGLHIGRRPIFAFGNSDGDLAMLRYTKTGPGPSEERGGSETKPVRLATGPARLRAKRYGGSAEAQRAKAEGRHPINAARRTGACT